MYGVEQFPGPDSGLEGVQSLLEAASNLGAHSGTEEATQAATRSPTEGTAGLQSGIAGLQSARNSEHWPV